MREANIQSNTIYNVIKSVSSIVFPLISFPYASRVLLTENMGKVSFGNSVVSYFALMASLGITTYAVRECALVRHNKEELGTISSQIFSINMLTTGIAYVLLALTLVFVRPLEDYRLLIILQSTTILFTSLGTDWLNTAMEDFRFITLRTVFFQVLSLVLMFLFVRSPEDYMLYALISVVSASGANIVNMCYRRRYCRVTLVRKMDLKRHMAPVMLLFSMILAQTVYCNSDVTMIGFFWGDHEVGLYSTSVKIYNIVNTMVASVALVLLPKLSYWFAKQDYGEINKLLRYGLNFMVVLGLPCVVGIYVAADGIVVLAAGPAYGDAVPSLRILTIALGASFLSGFQGNLILIPSGREKICLKASAVCAAVNVVLNSIFIPRFGIAAAAATTAAAEILGILIKAPYIEKQIDLGSVKDMLLAPVCGCVGIAVAAFVINMLIDNRILGTCLTIGISVAVYLAVLVLMKHEFTVNMLRRRKRREP